MIEKPLGGKAYGSTPHLPTSQVKSDKVVPEGQKRIATEQKRDDNDKVIIQEKYDGSCVSVAKIDGEVVPLVRAGYKAETSPYEQHHYFADWVYEREEYFNRLLVSDDTVRSRVVGEWLLQTHSTKYDIRDNKYDHRNEYGDNLLFVPFDIYVGGEQLPYKEYRSRILTANYNWAGNFRSDDQHVLYKPVKVPVNGPTLIEEAWQRLLKTHEENNHPRKPMPKPEGLVYRVERNGEVDFLCKWVRPDKQDGKYLPGLDSNDVEEPIWNYSPERLG